MKNTFKCLRKKVNGMFPYIVSVPGIDGYVYLFEMGKRMSLKRVWEIEKAFPDDERLIFATTDENMLKWGMQRYDCGNLEKFASKEREERKIYYYKDDKFYKTRKKRREDSMIILEITGEIEEIGKDWEKDFTPREAKKTRDIIDDVLPDERDNDIEKITEIANNALYFADNSDYESALWNILKIAKPDLFDNNGNLKKKLSCI